MPAAPRNDHRQARAPDPHAADSGDADTAMVVFVPGLGLDARSWQAVRRTFHGASVVVTLPSMGEPAPRATDLTVERQAERLLQALPTDQTLILVGHSASCPVVVHAAAQSHQIAGLVLVGPVTDPAADTWPRMLSQWLRAGSHERPAEAAALIPQYWRSGPTSMLRGMDSVRRFRTDLALAALRLPVEIVRGDKDRIASEHWSATLSRASDGRLTSVARAAHMVPLTHPRAVVAAVERLHVANGLSTHPLPH
jgi:pimeloyl-ACP methyl ester carboxylesterase